jgi:integrase/recombinase XerD
MVPILAIEENQETASVFNFGAVPTINPYGEISDVIEAFLASQIPNKRTARGYRRHITQAMERMGIEKLAALQPVHLMNFRSELMSDLRGAATKAQALIALRSFLTWGAAMRGHSLVMDQALYLLKVPKVTVITPHEVLSEKEIVEFLKAGKQEGPREHALLIVALGSGVRVAELVHLDIKDIRDDAGGGTVIHVRQGKGSKDRMIPVRPEVHQAVAAYLLSTGRKFGDIGPLFQSQDHAMGDRESWRLSTKTASKIIRECAEKAGIQKRITPHALRHTFAFGTYLHSRNLMAVMKLLGHTTIATTQRYVAHLDDLDLRKATPAFLVGAKGPRVSPSIKQPQVP